MSDPHERPAVAVPTRERLLAAAAELFAAQGYSGARIRDIAARAGANVAAINYHFGGKQPLYLEVLRSRARERLDPHPLPPPGIASTPQAVLEAAVAALIGRVLASDENGQLPRLMIRELAAPTAALPVLAQEVIAPQFARLQAIVAELLGPRADPACVQRCCFSIVGQCLFYLFAQPLVGVLAPATLAVGAERRLAVHIAAFSIGALTAMRRELESVDV